MWDSIVQEEPGRGIASIDELDDLESRYNVKLPEDLRSFLSIFGEGVLYNHFRIFGPATIDEETGAARERWETSFTWTSPRSALTEQQLAECVIIGDNFNYDELVVSPAFPFTVFFVPRDKDEIISFGTSLEHALENLVADLTAKVATYPQDERDEWDLRPVFNIDEF